MYKYNLSMKTASAYQRPPPTTRLYTVGGLPPFGGYKQSEFGHERPSVYRKILTAEIYMRRFASFRRYWTRLPELNRGHQKRDRDDNHRYREHGAERQVE
jgi:hypothetical protein